MPSKKIPLWVRYASYLDLQECREHARQLKKELGDPVRITKTTKELVELV